MTTGSELRDDPPPLSTVLAAGGGAIAIAVVAVTGGVLLVGTLLGVATILLGARRGSHRAIDVGGGIALSTVVLTGLAFPPAPLLLTAIVGVVVAWDMAGYAVDLGTQVGRDAATRSAELTHAAGSTAVGAVAAGGALALSTVAGGGQPIGVLGLQLAGAVALLWVLRT